MVMLVLKEGPGSNAWKQAINTIDVFLWSVQPHEQEGDRDRLETINPRLLNNLRKAMRIASVENNEIDAIIAGLKEVQESSFPGAAQEVEQTEPEDIAESSSQNEKEEPKEQEAEVEVEVEAEAEAEDEGILPLELAQQQALAEESSPQEPAVTIKSIDDVVHQEATSGQESVQPESSKEEPAEESTDEEPEEDMSAFLAQVDSLNAGMWVEFLGEDEQNTRCKLAAKINAIDKFIFVNRQGVKVVEKTKAGLARELMEGTVKIISDGLLFSRALESVIGNLR